MVESNDFRNLFVSLTWNQVFFWRGEKGCLEMFFVCDGKWMVETKDYCRRIYMRHLKYHRGCIFSTIDFLLMLSQPHGSQLGGMFASKRDVFSFVMANGWWKQKTIVGGFTWDIWNTIRDAFFPPSIFCPCSRSHMVRSWEVCLLPNLGQLFANLPCSLPLSIIQYFCCFFGGFPLTDSHFFRSCNYTSCILTVMWFKNT